MDREEPDGYTDSLCPECGRGVGVDEDGLCVSCGNTAVGTGAEKVFERIRELEFDLKAAREKLAIMRTFRETARETSAALGKQLETAREELKKERIDSDVTLGKFRAALTKAEQERDALREAGKSLLRAVYVGDGKVVCPNAIIGPVREMTAALSPAPDSEEG